MDDGVATAAPSARRTPCPAHARQTRSNGPAPSGDQTQATSKVPGRNPAPANVWSKQGAAQLRATLCGSAILPAHRASDVQNQDVDPALAVYYDCATRAANLRFDGDQRAMTKLEQVTLYKWMHREIHLPGRRVSSLKRTPALNKICLRITIATIWAIAYMAFYRPGSPSR
jgi:hypothetical protein